MPKSCAPRTVALRDQILGILRAHHPRTVPTGVVLTELANNKAVCGDPAPGSTGCVRAEWGHIRATDYCRAGCWYSRAYPQLVALTKLGLVERSWPEGPKGGQRQTHWRYVHDDQSDAYFNTVVSAMEASDA